MIPSEILTLITPLLCDMEECQVCLKYEDFIKLFDNLYKKMTIPEKKIILSFARDLAKPRKNEKINNFTFQVFFSYFYKK